MDNRYQAYRKVEINTTNRGKIVVMLYSGAVTFLNKAKACIEKKDHQNKAKFMNKALDIIDELNIALDLSKGQDIAKNLKSIYTFLGKYLSQACIDNDVKKIEEAIKILDTLKSAFEEILKNPENQEVQDISKREQTQNCIKKFA